MRRPGHVLILDCFGELALVLAVHVFSGLDAPGLFVPGVELDLRDRGSSEEIAEVVRPPARACDLFRLELRRRDLDSLVGCIRNSTRTQSSGASGLTFFCLCSWPFS